MNGHRKNLTFGEGPFRYCATTLQIRYHVFSKIWLIYELAEQARDACERLSDAIDSNVLEARRLNQRFSIGRMDAFVRKFILRNGLEALHHKATVTVDRTRGIAEFRNSTFLPMHIENVIDLPTDMRWGRIAVAEGCFTPHGAFALQTFRLDPQFVWNASALVSDPDMLHYVIDGPH